MGRCGKLDKEIHGSVILFNKYNSDNLHLFSYLFEDIIRHREL